MANETALNAMSYDQSMKGPAIWLLSDGRQGHDRLVMGIYASLIEPMRWTKLLHIPNFGAVSGKKTITPNIIARNFPFLMKSLPYLGITQTEHASLSQPFPNLIISAGRRASHYARWIKTQSDGQSCAVQILDPKNRRRAFDIIIAPAHDALNEPNTLSVCGSPVHFTSEAIEEAEQAFAPLIDERRPAVIVCLGGSNKSLQFRPHNAQRLLSKLEKIAFEQGWSVRITTSRRTPPEISILFRERAKEHGWAFWSGPQDGPNPYLGWLLYSHAAIITQDSVNMLSEAAWFGLPIHIHALEGSSGKFGDFLEGLRSTGAARMLENNLERWEYPPVRESEQIADAIVTALCEKWQRPEN